MSRAINRAAWSPEECDEYETLLALVVDSSTDTRERLDTFERLLNDAVQAHRPWATEVSRACRRNGLSGEIRRHQGRQRVPVSYDGRVLSVPAVQSRRVVTASGEVAHQRELLEYWTWDDLRSKRAEAVKAANTYTENIAAYDRLLMLGELAPASATPAEAAAALGVDLGEWLGRAA